MDFSKMFFCFIAISLPSPFFLDFSFPSIDVKSPNQGKWGCWGGEKSFFWHQISCETVQGCQSSLITQYAYERARQTRFPCSSTVLVCCSEQKEEKTEPEPDFYHHQIVLGVPYTLLLYVLCTCIH